MRVDVMLQSVVAAGLVVREMDADTVLVGSGGPHHHHPGEQPERGLSAGHVRQQHPHVDPHFLLMLRLDPVRSDDLHGGGVTEDLQAGHGNIRRDSGRATAVLADDADRVVDLDAVECAFFFCHLGRQAVCWEARLHSL